MTMTVAPAHAGTHVLAAVLLDSTFLLRQSVIHGHAEACQVPY
jgi:hypothetical protein